MGILDDILSEASDPTGSKRRKALEEMSMAQLRQLAKDLGVELRNEGFFSSGEALRSKDEVIEKILASGKATPAKLAALKASVPPAPSTETPPGDVKPAKESKPPLGPTTPTVASSKSPPLVAFEEVVHYLDQYRFISRYREEAFYEVELAGALRERFGTVVRQNPVPVAGKRLAIDLDVGGVGIEIKANVTTDKPLRDALAQLADYRQHYGEKLVFLLIGTHGLDARKQDIRQTGVVFIEK